MKFSKTEDQWKEFLESFNVELADFSSAKERHKSYLSINCRNCGTQERVRAENLIRRRNHPCLSCANRTPYDTDRIKTLIAENGGIYLSGTVQGKESIVSYICCCGNQVEKTAHDLTRRPKTCRHCRAQGISKTQLEKSNNLEVAKTLAKERGGKCLETGEPFPTTQPILWECSRGHSWRATLTSVKSLGTWCPECSVSIAENSIRAIFEGVFNRPFPAARPEFLRDVGLSLDGYNEELSLAYEHQGIHTTSIIPCFIRGMQIYINKWNATR